MSDKPFEFKIFSGMLRAYEQDGRKRISTTASSTVTDHYGDEMTESCIKGMATSAASKMMTIFLNHEYKVPEDVFGRTAASEAKYAGLDPKTGLPMWDLDLDVEVDETNPRAVQTYRSLRGPKDDGDGQKLGVSIGALIKDYELKDPRDPWSSMKIKDVELLEASIVGIPANPRSWVKSAVRSYKASFNRTDDKNPAVALGVDINELIDRLDDPTAGDDLPERKPLQPEVTRAASDNDADDEDRQDGPHDHSHGHAHDHEHTHGYGDNEHTHSHDHAHMHSHEHDDGHHGSADDQADWEHNHNHDGAQGNHAHEKDASGLIETPDPIIDTEKSVPATEERPTDEVELPAVADGAQDEPPSEPSEIERSVEIALDSLTRMVREQRSEINERDAQINQLTRERDEALQSLRLAMRFVEKLARTPLGKKTQFAAPISDFREKFAGVYDEEVLKFLEK